MNTPRPGLRIRTVRAFLLWGYGWKRRTDPRHPVGDREWQDPASGLWYPEETAFRLMKAHCIAPYGEPNRKTSEHRVYF